MEFFYRIVVNKAMNSQSNGRNQRSKGFKLKQVLQLVVLLVIGIWLLYQIKNSSNDNQEKDALGLGRKVDTGRSKSKTDPKARNYLTIFSFRDDQKESGRENKELQKVDNITESTKGEENDEKDHSSPSHLFKGSDEDIEPTNIALQHDETANGTTTISFNDETGIPQDVKEEQSGVFYNERGEKNELATDGVEENNRDVHQELEEVIEKSTSQHDE